MTICHFVHVWMTNKSLNVTNCTKLQTVVWWNPAWLSCIRDLEGPGSSPRERERERERKNSEHLLP